MNINIAIDRYSASGKTTIGQFLARKFKYELIDNRLFYRYFSYHSFILSSSDDDVLKFIRSVENYKDLLEDIKSINLLDNETYLKVGKKASKLAKNNEIREEINILIRRIIQKKGFVVVGRDTTFNILLEAEVKIVLSAEFLSRVKRRALQVDMTEEESLEDLFMRDKKSFDLIKQAKRVSKNIDTTNINVDETLDQIITIIDRQLFLSRYEKYVNILFFIVILIFYKLYLLVNANWQ